MPLCVNSPKIFLIDDHVAELATVICTLEEAGYAVTAFDSGRQAINFAKVQKPDVVLLDLMMPDMDGWATCRALRNSGCAGVPIIVLTGAHDPEALTRAFSAGAVDFITKPFLFEELLARLRTHLDLKIARDHFVEMLREREDMTHMVAHDLKSPLNAVLFAARTLQNEVSSPSEQELIGDVIGSTKEALQFIQRFLARGAEGERLRKIRAEVFELQDVSRNAVATQQRMAKARGMRIFLQGRAPAYADPLLTGNVVKNLISNAIRYAPAGSPVEMEIGDTRAGRARLLVMDRGPGVPDTVLDRLFKRYTRLACGRDPAIVTPHPEASGVGLAIAKRSVAEMGGHLWYEARGGGGSVFGIELPRAS